jgi:hypothetical protein
MASRTDLLLIARRALEARDESIADSLLREIEREMITPTEIVEFSPALSISPARLQLMLNEIEERTPGGARTVWAVSMDMTRLSVRADASGLVAGMPVSAAAIENQLNPAAYHRRSTLALLAKHASVFADLGDPQVVFQHFATVAKGEVYDYEILTQIARSPGSYRALGHLALALREFFPAEAERTMERIQWHMPEIAPPVSHVESSHLESTQRLASTAAQLASEVERRVRAGFEWHSNIDGDQLAIVRVVRED